MIGLYGVTCNNLYAFSKALNERSIPVKYFFEEKDKFPHSMPVWDDVVDSVNSEINFEKFNWELFEKKNKWTKPNWVILPEKNSVKVFFSESKAGLFYKIIAWFFLRKKPGITCFLSEMKKCDFLIVCGVVPSILASFSGVNYVVFPHGSEFRKMVGIEKQGEGIRAQAMDLLIIRAFKQASAFISSCPYGSAGVPFNDFARFSEVKIKQICIPYKVHHREEMGVRRRKLKALFDMLNIKIKTVPQKIGIVPSRIDFHWKGHDRILKALNETKNDINIVMIFLGWGTDSLEAKQIIEDNNLTDRVIFIPQILTRQLLFLFFDSVDFIIDNLKSTGTYGATFSDAVSRGCPSFSWINQDDYLSAGWDVPPTLSINSKEQVVTLLRKLDSEEIDLKKITEDQATWFKKHHSYSSVVDKVLDLRQHVNSNINGNL